MLKRELEDYKVLLRSVPGVMTMIFVICIIAMNLLANKEFLTAKYFALDCGFVVSWVSFLCMDIICKRFGPKAAIKMSVLALIVNLIVCLLFKIMTLTPGMWGEYYSYGMTEVNDALNSTFGGSWYVVLGSSVAMIASSVVNALLNQLVAKHLRKDNFLAFALRSYVSTGVAQFVDNLLFALIVSHIFFGWTWAQVIICSLTGAVAELLMEVFLSPVGYRVVRSWEKDDVGRQYLDWKDNEE